jgi:hypothetical protein
MLEVLVTNMILIKWHGCDEEQKEEDDKSRVEDDDVEDEDEDA